MILHQLIDYEILRVIWWLLLGVVLIGFAVTGGVTRGLSHGIDEDGIESGAAFLQSVLHSA